MGWIIRWLARATLYHFKIALFTFLSTAFLFNINIAINFKELTFVYSNGSISLWVIITMVGICLLLIGLDFWLEKIKIKERTNQKLLNALMDPNLPISLKDEIIKYLRKRD